MQKARLTYKDSYKYYLENAKKPVDYKTFILVLDEFYLDASVDIIEKKLNFIVPGNLGVIRVIKKETPSKIKDGEFVKLHSQIDWKATKEYWFKKYTDLTWEEILKIKDKPKIYYKNNHSGIYNYRFDWLITTDFAMLKKALNKYYFRAVRGGEKERYGKRGLASFALNPLNDTDYLGIEKLKT